jgi:hypothetical protein
MKLKIRDILNQGIKAEEAKRNQAHVSSGKLSASALGQPMQWNVLKYLGIPKKASDEYELLKFRRGRDVEDFLCNMIASHPGLTAKMQVDCQYFGCVGQLDVLIVDEKNPQPIEIKSTGSSAYKHILKEGQAKKNHALQAAFYALALDMPEFTVCYVNSDTYQTIDFSYKTKDFKKEIDRIIAEFNQTIEKQIIPVFQPQERWQSLAMYQQYPDYATLDARELKKIAAELYLKKGGKNV